MSLGAEPVRRASEPQSDWIRGRVTELAPWYHKIDLGHGIVTPGRDFEHIWNPTRQVLDTLDYRGKKVLDLASWDGMWAFDAERRGAALVVSTDIRLEGYANLLFAREVLCSKVVPLCNVPVQELDRRLGVVGLPERYDVIHHFGLFYHLRDPLLSLAQCRRLLEPGGALVLETAYIDDDRDSYMQFSGLPGEHHFYGITDTWAPTKRCLREVLQRSFLRPVREETWRYHRPSAIRGVADVLRSRSTIGRITLVAEPMAPEEGEAFDRHKVFGPQ